MSDSRGYTAVAIVLHWAIAAAIVANVLLGWWMHEAIEAPQTAARAFVGYQVHKSIGLSVLALSLARLAWRLAHPPPALPARMPAWEKRVARAVHWTFYGLLLLIPLSGWLYVSAGWSHETGRPLSAPTIWFGLFEVPHLFGLDRAAPALRASIAAAAIETHEALVWAMLALLVLHVAAALKHWLIDRDEVLAHMAPGVPLLGPHEKAPPDPRRRLALAAGFALTLAAAGAVGATLFRPPLAQPAPSAPPAPATAEAPATAPAAPPEASAPARSAAWRVDRARSFIRFSGDQGGTPFAGEFARWRAQIVFDPANLDAARAAVTVETASARDGDPIHDSALAGAEWFDSANHPTATFRTTRIRHRGGDAYEARGELTIKGQTQRIEMPFTLAIDGDRATMDGQAEIDRHAAGLGNGSAADDYVSRTITVTVHVEARRAP